MWDCCPSVPALQFGGTRESDSVSSIKRIRMDVSLLGLFTILLIRRRALIGDLFRLKSRRRSLTKRSKPYNSCAFRILLGHCLEKGIGPVCPNNVGRIRYQTINLTQ